MIVFDSTKPTETHLVDIRFQWTKRSDEDVNPEVELFTANEKWVVYVPGYNISISRRLLWNICSSVRPFF